MFLFIYMSIDVSVRSFGGQDDGPGEISIRKNELTNNRSLGSLNSLIVTLTQTLTLWLQP